MRILLQITRLRSWIAQFPSDVDDRQSICSTWWEVTFHTVYTFTEVWEVILYVMSFFLSWFIKSASLTSACELLIANSFVNTLMVWELNNNYIKHLLMLSHLLTRKRHGWKRDNLVLSICCLWFQLHTRLLDTQWSTYLMQLVSCIPFRVSRPYSRSRQSCLMSCSECLVCEWK